MCVVVAVEGPVVSAVFGSGVVVDTSSLFNAHGAESVTILS